MITETTVEGLTEELIGWTIGTMSKGYDEEEEADAIDADTRAFVKAILEAYEKERI